MAALARVSERTRNRPLAGWFPRAAGREQMSLVQGLLECFAGLDLRLIGRGDLNGFALIPSGLLRGPYSKGHGPIGRQVLNQGDEIAGSFPVNMPINRRLMGMLTPAKMAHANLSRTPRASSRRTTTSSASMAAKRRSKPCLPRYERLAARDGRIHANCFCSPIFFSLDLSMSAPMLAFRELQS